MSDIKLFRISAEQAVELLGKTSDLEKPLQSLIEKHLEPLLGVRFLATEYVTGKTHGGRIDTLGLDENNCPVIIEYKRQSRENVINQGLFYLDWLMDHKGEFERLVTKKWGSEVADQVDWSAPRLLCIAGDFDRYDGHAVAQIERNIELIRYRKFDDDLLLFEQAATGSSVTAKKKTKETKILQPSAAEGGDSLNTLENSPEVLETIKTLPSELSQLMETIDEYIFALGDDVQRKDLKLYVAYKRLKNFATVVPGKTRLLINLHMDPEVVLKNIPDARDVRNIGHWGTGDVEITLESMKDFEECKPYVVLAYEGRTSVTA